MPYTFENLNVPFEPTTEDIRWMSDCNRRCEIEQNLRCQCTGECASCIYARVNSGSRKRFAMEKFPDMFFDGIYTWGIIPEVTDTFMLRNGKAGCSFLGRRHPSERTGTCRMACTECIFAYENSIARKNYYKKHHPNAKVCEICGDYHENLIEYKGYHVCAECLGRGVAVCTLCGGLVAEYKTVVNNEGLKSIGAIPVQLIIVTNSQSVVSVVNGITRITAWRLVTVTTLVRDATKRNVPLVLSVVKYIRDVNSPE